MSLQFTKAMLQDGAKRVYEWLKKGEGYPNWLLMKDKKTLKEHKLTKQEYFGLYENVNVFLLKNGRWPNYATLDHKATYNPLVMDYQDTNYTCCPTSLAMASQLVFNYKSEKECSKALGTQKGSGTSPEQLINGAGKLGFKITPIKRNVNEVSKFLNRNLPVIAHFQVDQTRNCKGDYISKFGHYSLIWRIEGNNYVLADPSKGVSRKYGFKCLDNANKGYRQNYYAVSPK